MMRMVRVWRLQQSRDVIRVRARITSPVWVLKRLSGKARELRILPVWKGRATPPDGMDRRPNRERYCCANPNNVSRLLQSPYSHHPHHVWSTSCTGSLFLLPLVGNVMPYNERCLEVELRKWVGFAVTRRKPHTSLSH